MTGANVITVLVVDDHPFMRSGLAGEINSQPDMRVVAEANDGRECLEKFKKHVPDVTLLDLRMPNMNGLDALKAIRGVKPDARVIILTTLVADVQVYRALQAGAMGYLLKSLLQNELVETVRAVMKGQRRMPPEIASEIAMHATDEDLTERELSVLRAISKGCSNKIIGAEMGISEHTIKNHVQNILAKLGANDRTHAVTIALQRGFIEM
jgi:DNA-binding NarL/FixJ family response regulator